MSSYPFIRRLLTHVGHTYVSVHCSSVRRGNGMSAPRKRRHLGVFGPHLLQQVVRTDYFVLVLLPPNENGAASVEVFSSWGVENSVSELIFVFLLQTIR